MQIVLYVGLYKVVHVVKISLRNVGMELSESRLSALSGQGREFF